MLRAKSKWPASRLANPSQLEVSFTALLPETGPPPRLAESGRDQERGQELFGSSRPGTAP